MNTTATSPELIKILESVSLSVFNECLNDKSYSGLGEWCNTTIEDYDYVLFNPIIVDDIDTSKIKNQYYAVFYHAFLVTYLHAIRYYPEHNNIWAKLIKQHSIYLELIEVNEIFLLLIQNYRQEEADKIEAITGVAIKSETNISDLKPYARIKLLRFNKLSSEIDVLLPQHTKDYFLSIIEQTELIKIYGGNVTAEQIFNDITLSEYIEHFKSIKTNPDDIPIE